jgi:hypothetical protein
MDDSNITGPSRRAVLGGALGTSLALAMTGTARADARAAAVSAPAAGRHDRPFGAYLGAIAERRYVEEEFFLSGAAAGFALDGAQTPDGRWTVTSTEATPYKTRILVRRPRDARAFNGTVVVEWANVSSGLDLAFCDAPGLYDGFAHVLVSAQRHGVHGLPVPQPQGLVQWDPERYGGLSIPTDALSYDIFSQAARAVGPHRSSEGADPLGGLKVRKLIAVGASQSGSRLLTYANAVQPRETVFDAIVPVICAGAAAPLGDIGPAAVSRSPPLFTHVRDDLAIPVLMLNSETEAAYYAPWRQPDTARFVSWEVAGASHICARRLAWERRLAARDEVVIRWHPQTSAPEPHPSEVDWLPTLDAGFANVHRWIHGGQPPTSIPPIITSGERPAVARDAFGNALGGIRLPELEVPVARYEGGGGGNLLGLTDPFEPETLRCLYPSHDAYVDKVRKAAEAALRSGVILPERAKHYIANSEVQKSASNNEW